MQKNFEFQFKQEDPRLLYRQERWNELLEIKILKPQLSMKLWNSISKRNKREINIAEDTTNERKVLPHREKSF